MIVKAIAPARILDFGGWTDTWFAQHGRVLNLAVDLYSKVVVSTREQPDASIIAQDYGEAIEIADPSEVLYDGKHDLLKAALNVTKVDGVDIPERPWAALRRRGGRLAARAGDPQASQVRRCALVECGTVDQADRSLKYLADCWRGASVQGVPSGIIGGIRSVRASERLIGRSSPCPSPRNSMMPFSRATPRRRRK